MGRIKIMELDVQENTLPEERAAVEKGHPGAEIVGAARVWIEGTEKAIEVVFGLQPGNHIVPAPELGQLLNDSGDDVEEAYTRIRELVFRDQ